MPPEGDAGASPERTRLSWRRTTLAGAAVAVLLARLALHQNNRTLGVITTALAALGWVFLLGLVQRRIHDLADPGRPPRRILMLAAATCLALAALGVVLVAA